MTFYKNIENSVFYKKKKYYFIDDFRCFLKALEILGDNEILIKDKYKTICYMLFGKYNLKKSIELVNLYFKKIEENTTQAKKKSEKKVFDFKQDSDLIFSAFLQTYTINLANDYLSVFDFLALLNGLPTNTKFAEVIKIRTMKIPQPNNANREYINSLLEAKKSVELKNDNPNFRKLGDFVKLYSK